MPTAAAAAPRTHLLRSRRYGLNDARDRRRARRLRERERDVLGGLEPVPRILLQTMPHDVIQRGRNVSTRRRQLRRLVPDDRGERVARRVLPERSIPREELVQDRPERKDVRAVIDREPARLLRRHVPDRPHHLAGLRLALDRRGLGRLAGFRGLDPLRQPEVQDLDVTVPRDEHVLGFQVPVDDPVLVRRREALRDL